MGLAWWWWRRKGGTLPPVPLAAQSNFEKIQPKDAANPQFWLGCLAGRAKNYIAPLLKDAATYPGKYPWLGPLTPGQFQRLCEKVGRQYGINARILRGNQIIESGFHPNTLALNRVSTALGLSQFVKDTAADQGIPWPNLIVPEVAVEAMARLIRARGWPEGYDFVPTKEQIEAEHAKYPRGEKPAPWYFALCAYKTKRLEDSNDSGRARLLAALRPDIWSFNSGNWMHWDPGLEVFTRGSKVDVKGTPYSEIKPKPIYVKKGDA